MRIIIRVDASTDIGTGHVIRCLTLANALKKKSHDVTFICRNLKDHLITHIEQNGFDVIELTQSDNIINVDEDVPHASWLPVSWKNDADECSQ